jgi:nucleoside-diphosphate-sugar epimerase
MKDFWENKKILVTGGAGFIGSNVVANLMEKRAKVSIVVSPETPDKKLQAIFKNLSKIKIIRADLLSFESARKATGGHDVVFHFAALDGGAVFKKQHAAEILNVNIQLAINILESSRINNVGRIFLPSSTEIYSPLLRGKITEDKGDLVSLGDDFGGYAWSKRFMEILAKKYFEQYGMKIAIARLANVYGPMDLAGVKRGRVIPTFINNAIHNNDILILGSGKVNKSFLFVEDLIKAIFDLTEKYPTCIPVNIASEKYISIEGLAKLIIKLSKSKSKLVVNSTCTEKMLKSSICIDRAKKEISFKSRINLKEGLKKVLQSQKSFTF